MEIQFLGAAKIVTGSCYLFNANNKKILLECGMFQGSKDVDSLNYEPFKFDPKSIDFVVLSHAHIDHSGLIPKLVKNGFNGQVICTPITRELCQIMLEDSANLQEKNTESVNKRRLRQGKMPYEPMYTIADAKKAMKQFSVLKYDTLLKLNENFSVNFKDAGHILGSAIVELFVTEGSKKTKFVFSGDLGQRNLPLVEDPDLIQEADYILVESTYGNRLHESSANIKKEFAKVILDNIKKGGKLFIPSFAVERTQEVLYILSELLAEKKIPEVEVYLDTPLGIKATKIFEKYVHLMDKEAKSKKVLFNFRGLHVTPKKEDSIKLNSIERPIIIIAGSGMCTGGRIVHHLKNGIWNPKNTLLFVGYQAMGTTGRDIIEGAKTIRLFGEEIVVRAKIESIDSLSAHADYNDILWWLKGFKQKPKKVFIIHGEPESQIALQEKIHKLTMQTYIPSLGEKIKI